MTDRTWGLSPTRGRRTRPQAEALEARLAPAIIGLEAADQSLATTTAGAQFLPRMVMRPDGAGFVAVWVGPDGGQVSTESDYGVYARRYDANWQPVGNDFRVNTTTTNQQHEPDVAIDSSGNFTIVWTSTGQLTANNREVVMRRYSAAGTALTGETVVNTTTASDQTLAQIGMNPAGAFVVTWASGPFLTENLFARAFNSSGTATTGEVQVNVYTTDDQVFGDVAVDTAGNFVVAWSSYGQDAANGFGNYVRGFTAAGAATTAEVAVNTTTAGSQGRPRLHRDSAGNLTVVWSSPNIAGGDQSEVVMRRFNSSLTALTGETVVNTTLASAQFDPDISGTAAGAYVVVWQSGASGGTTGDIYYRTYNSSGTATSGEVLVNVTAAGSSQFSPAVGMDTAGDFAVAFVGNQSGAEDVYLRRFAEAPVAQFASATPSAGEAAGTATVSVSRTGAAYTLANLATSVTVSRTGGTATPGTDFTNPFPGTFTINAGSLSGSIGVTIADDTLVEANETILLGIAVNTSGHILGSQSTATFSITDNDAPASVAVTGGNNQSTAIGSTFTSPLTVEVRNAGSQLVQGASVTFTAPGSGASAVFSNSTNTLTVTTNASGVATSGSLSANLTAGANYTVTAAAGAPSVSFTLSNGKATVNGTASVRWGTTGTATVSTAGDGLRLLPTGRTTSLPWVGVNRLLVTLNAATTLVAGDVAVAGTTVANYGPVTVSGTSPNYTLTFNQPINAGDRVTVTIGNSNVTTYTRRLDVLPGDVNDGGFVNTTDLTVLRSQFGTTTSANLVSDYNGDGTVNATDFTAARPLIGTAFLGPLFVAPGGVATLSPTPAPRLTADALAPVLAAAIRRWQATGLTAEQSALLHGVSVRIGNIPGGYLGVTPLAGTTITLDDDAAGVGWYVDPTPLDDAEFPSTATPTRLTTARWLAPAGRIDLLTVVMHELGHVLGRDSVYDPRLRDDVMYAYLTAGERRRPVPAVAPSVVRPGPRF